MTTNRTWRRRIRQAVNAVLRERLRRENPATSGESKKQLYTLWMALYDMIDAALPDPKPAEKARKNEAP